MTEMIAGKRPGFVGVFWEHALQTEMSRAIGVTPWSLEARAPPEKRSTSIILIIYDYL